MHLGGDICAGKHPETKRSLRYRLAPGKGIAVISSVKFPSLEFKVCSRGDTFSRIRAARSRSPNRVLGANGRCLASSPHLVGWEHDLATMAHPPHLRHPRLNLASGSRTKQKP